MHSATMSLAELAEQSGVPPRTIRFYIARGLLEGPSKGGRGAVYTERHLERLREIRRLQEGGRMLSEIAATGNGSTGPASAVGEPESWWRYELAPDVVVQVRAGTSPWRTRQVRNALDDFARRLRNTPDKEREDGE